MGTLFLTAALAGCVATVSGPAAVNVQIGGFYDELAPYGRWVDCSYGQCWVPARVATDWQPYSNGHWIYTEYGWTWVSADPWGGNPYHYGTWASIPVYGWSWVPGTVWAPAWVTWSYSNSYVGWAPIPPTVVFGASGYTGGPVVVSQTQYVFVPTNRFVGGNVRTVRMAPQESAQILRQTRPVTGFAVSGGIVRNTALPMETIERASGARIETRSVQAAGTAPRAVSAGAARLAVVAPAREVKASATRPQPAPDSRQAAPEATRSPQPVDREPAAATARQAPVASPRESSRPPAEAPAARQPAPPRDPEPSRQDNPPSRPPPQSEKEQPVENSDRQPVATPAARRPVPPRKVESGRPAERAPKPTPEPGNDERDERGEKPDPEER
jgi:hypothetical protein